MSTSNGIAHSKTTAGRIRDLADHAHSVQQVYPDLGDAIEVTSAADAWTLGDAVTIIPVSTVALPFDIHYVDISAISGNDEYQLELYENGCVMQVTFVKSATADPVRPLRVQGCIIPANSAVTAKLANKTGAQTRTVNIKLWYHTY
jgi:hypothetical protein